MKTTKRFQNLHGTKLAQSGTKILDGGPVSFARHTGSNVDVATCNFDRRPKLAF
jgi:hypothetical protein